MVHERQRTLPMSMTCTVVVRAPDQARLERRTKWATPACQGPRAELRLLRWEQRAGWLRPCHSAAARAPRPGGVHRRRGCDGDRWPFGYDADTQTFSLPAEHAL